MGMRPPLGKLMYSMTDWPDEGEWLLKWLAWRSQSNCGPRRSASSVYCVCVLCTSISSLSRVRQTAHPITAVVLPVTQLIVSQLFDTTADSRDDLRRHQLFAGFTCLKRSMISPSALIVEQVSGCCGKDKEDGGKNTKLHFTLPQTILLVYIYSKLNKF